MMPCFTDARQEHTTGLLHSQLSLCSTLDCIALILGHRSESSITYPREHHPHCGFPPGAYPLYSIIPDSRPSRRFHGFADGTNIAVLIQQVLLTLSAMLNQVQIDTFIVCLATHQSHHGAQPHHPMARPLTGWTC
jgi:hypothetical protein